MIPRARRAHLRDLLELIAQQRPSAPEPGGLGPAREEAVRLVPPASLTFPAADIAGIRAEPATDGHAERWRIEFAGFGLYGPSSPLPASFTEDLFDNGRDGEAERCARLRAFYDIFNHRLISLLVRALRVHRPLAPAAGRVRRRVAGSGPDADAAAPSGIDHVPLLAGLLSRRPMSAAALESALAAWLPGCAVRVEPLIATWADLPPSERARIGAPLGGALGARVRSCATAFRIRLTATSPEALADLLPGGAGHARALALAGEANPNRLDVLIRIAVAPGAIPPTTLGSTARLGRTTRLVGPDRGHLIDLPPHRP